jgi:hypothetical protein
MRTRVWAYASSAYMEDELRESKIAHTTCASCH